MAVDQDGDQGRFLAAFGNQKRWAQRVIEDTRGKAHPCEAGNQFVGEIAAQLIGAFRLLAAARDRHSTPQLGDELATVEVLVGASNGGGAAHLITLRGEYA